MLLVLSFMVLWMDKWNGFRATDRGKDVDKVCHIFYCCVPAERESEAGVRELLGNTQSSSTYEGFKSLAAHADPVEQQIP